LVFYPLMHLLVYHKHKKKHTHSNTIPLYPKFARTAAVSVPYRYLSY